MDEASLTAEDWQRIGEAIVIWTGKDSLKVPHRDDSRVRNRFGKELASTLLPLIKYLDEAFYSTDACRTTDGLSEMYDVACAQFRARYPLVPEAAVDDLGWCYTFDNR